jgi:hypothetical protein
MELSMNKWNKSIAALLCALMLTLCLGACAPAAPENPDAAVSASAEPAQTTAAPFRRPLHPRKRLMLRRRGARAGKHGLPADGFGQFGHASRPLTRRRSRSFRSAPI